MTVTEAVQSASQAEVAWLAAEASMKTPFTGVSRKSGPIAWRLYSWLKPGLGREHVGPSISPVTGLKHRRWSNISRDAAQAADLSWLETVISVYSWVVSVENPEIDAVLLARMIAKEMKADQEAVGWTATLISFVHETGWFNPRTDFERLPDLCESLTRQQLQHLQDTDVRVYGASVDYRDYLQRGRTDRRSVERADLLYWLSYPNWIEEASDIPSSRLLLQTFFEVSVCPGKNAFLYGLLYALSEQDPVFSMSQFKETYPQAFAEYQDALPFFQVD